MTLRVFILLYVIVIVGLYVITGRGASPIIMPGDLYIKTAGRTVYVPFASAFIFSLIFLIIFKVVLPNF